MPKVTPVRLVQPLMRSILCSEFELSTTIFCKEPISRYMQFVAVFK